MQRWPHLQGQAGVICAASRCRDNHICGRYVVLIAWRHWSVGLLMISRVACKRKVVILIGKYPICDATLSAVAIMECAGGGLLGLQGVCAYCSY
jgi:hypothetical protein